MLMCCIHVTKVPCDNKGQFPLWNSQPSSTIKNICASNQIFWVEMGGVQVFWGVEMFIRHLVELAVDDIIVGTLGKES